MAVQVSVDAVEQADIGLDVDGMDDKADIDHDVVKGLILGDEVEPCLVNHDVSRNTDTSIMG